MYYGNNDVLDHYIEGLFSVFEEEFVCSFVGKLDCVTCLLRSPNIRQSQV